MHPIQAKLEIYLDKVARGEATLPEAVIKEVLEKCFVAVKEQVDTSVKPFTLRMSNVGKPICQLLAEKLNMPKEANSTEFFMRMLQGTMLEHIVVLLLKAAGVNITAEQKHVTIPELVSGTFDIEVDGEYIYDIKSCSKYAYNNKFTSFESLEADDTFGYVTQLFGYCIADNKIPGGWIVINKDSGEIKVIDVPSHLIPAIKSRVLNQIVFVTRTIGNSDKFERNFEDVEETFYKKPTGNRHLNYVCSMCVYKHSCWPGLQYKQDQSSSAKNKPYKYYTKLKDD